MTTRVPVNGINSSALPALLTTCVETRTHAPSRCLNPRAHFHTKRDRSRIPGCGVSVTFAGQRASPCLSVFPIGPRLCLASPTHPAAPWTYKTGTLTVVRLTNSPALQRCALGEPRAVLNEYTCHCVYYRSAVT